MPADGFNTKNFTAELGRVFGQYRQYNRRSTPLLLEQLGAKLSIDAYLEAARLIPKQKAIIEALPARLGYRIKRRETGSLARGNEFDVFKKGKRKGQYRQQSISAQAVRAGGNHVTIADEIRLRKRWAGIYQASGWLSELTTRLIKSAGRFKQGAIVVKQLSGSHVTLRITNPRTHSAEYADSTGYLARAFQRRIADMQIYIQRKLNGDAREFSRPRPNFNKDPRAAVEEAMRGAIKLAA